jgi:tetratricopeptide (TPR) repeat protein
MNSPKPFQKPRFKLLNSSLQILLILFLIIFPPFAFSQDLNPKILPDPKYWLGIAHNPPTNNSSDNSQNDFKKGILVEYVYPYGPAFNGGIKENDLIVEVNGIQASEINDFSLFLKDLPEKENVTFKIIRKDSMKNFSISIEIYDKDQYLKKIDAIRSGKLTEENRLKVAIFFTKLNMLSTAEEELNRVLEKNKNNAVAHLILGISYSSRKDYGQAVEAFKKSIAILPNQEEALYQLAETYISANKYEKAVEPLKKLIAVNPRHLRAHNGLGFLYESEKNYDAAIKEFDEALKIDPKVYYARFQIARIQNIKGEYQKAYDRLVEINSLYPGDVAALVETAHSLEKMGEIESATKIYERIIELKPDPDDVRALDETAQALKKIGELEKAAKMYERIVELKPNNDYYFYELGFVYEKLKKLDKSFDSLIRAVELNPYNVAARFSLAGIYGEKGEIEKELQEYQKLIAINPNYVAPQILATTYTGLGKLSSSRHDLGNALKYFKKAIDIEPKNPFNHDNIANLYSRLTQISAAKKHFNIAIELDPENSYSYINIGDLYRKTGELNKAINSYDKALHILEADENKNNNSYAHTLHLMAVTYGELRSFSESEDYLKKAVKHQRDEFGDKSVEHLKAYSHLGDFYQGLPNLEEALAVYSRVLTLQSEMTGKNNEFYADTLLNLGMIAIQQGKYDTGESYLIDSLRIKENFPDKSRSDLANNYVALATLYGLINLHNKEEEYIGKYSVVVKNIFGEDSLVYADALGMMGRVDRYKNDTARRFELSEKVVNIYEKLGNTSTINYATALMGMAESSFMLGNIEKAKIISEKLIDHPDKPIRAMALCLSAMINVSINNFDAAESQYEAALIVIDEYMGKNHTSYANGLIFLAALKAKKGEYQIAWEQAKSAKIIIAGQLRRIFSFASEKDKLEYMSALNGALGLHASIALKVINQKSTAEDLFVAVLNFKNITLDSLVKQNKAIISNPQLKALHEDLGNLKQKYSNLKLRSSLLGENDFSQSKPDQGNIFDELNKNIDTLESKITRIISKPENSTAIKKIDVPTLQASLPNKSVLVEFAKFNINKFTDNSNPKSNYLAFILNEEKFGPSSVINLGDSELIDSTIEEFRNLIQNKEDESTVKKVGSKLYRLLFKPLLAQINKASHIYISPDSDISFLPFDTLVDDGGEYLISKYKFSYLNNGKDIIRFVSRSSSHNQRVVLVGNPDFDNFAYSSSSGSIDQNQSIPKTRSAEIDELSFASLPGTKKEINAVGQIMKKYNPVVYANKSANELNMKSVNSPWILHIATHGFFLKNKALNKNESYRRGISIEPLAQSKLLPGSNIIIDNPLLNSGLALSGANAFFRGGMGESGEDGLLVAMEVLGMNLTDTDLVVLSACNTGVGKVKRGHGVFGLRRSFQQAGAKSLIMSLWQIPDEETKDLMVEFYKGLFDGKSKLNALHEASLSVMKSVKDKYKSTHPFYWGGFILIGNPGTN